MDNKNLPAYPAPFLTGQGLPEAMGPFDGREGMKYSDETIVAIADAIAGMPFNSSAHETIAVMLRALESTDEQKALREDAERWKHVLKLPFQSVWQLFCICPSPIERNKAVDQAIDNAREA